MQTIYTNCAVGSLCILSLVLSFFHYYTAKHSSQNLLIRRLAIGAVCSLLVEQSYHTGTVAECSTVKLTAVSDLNVANLNYLLYDLSQEVNIYHYVRLVSQFLVSTHTRHKVIG